jgi:hypothetical protein
VSRSAQTGRRQTLAGKFSALQRFAIGLADKIVGGCKTAEVEYSLRSQRFALMLVAAFHAIECPRRSLLAA